MKKKNRSSQALRDALFDELDDLRGGDGDPTRALAVARLAQQIISTAKVEMEFHKMIVDAAEKGQAITMGSMQLGSPNPPSPAASAEDKTTEH